MGDVAFDPANVEGRNGAPFSILLQGWEASKRVRPLWFTQDFRWYLCHSGLQLIVWWREP
jgi:hypothetical protein